MGKKALGFLIAAALLAISFLLDKQAASVAQAIQTPFLTAAVSVFDKLYWWIYAAFLALTIAAVIAKEPKEKRGRSVLLLLSGILTATAITRLLKFLIQRQRPDGAAFFLPFFGAQDYSFPSGHATAAGAAAMASPAFMRAPWIVFTAATMFDRVYLNVHFLSDTAAGIVVAMAVTWLLKSALKPMMVREDVTEIRRQALHLLIGLAIAAFVWKYQQLWYATVAVAAAGIVLSCAIKHSAAIKNEAAKQFRKLAVATLSLVERREELQKFPGKGAIMLFLGSGTAAAIFDRETAVAAIVILAVGDSVSHLAGRLFGRIKHRWIFAREKTMEGTVSGFVFAAAAAAFIAPVWAAVIAAAAGMAIEAIHLRIGKIKIDDNLTVPMAAAAVMWALGMV